MPSCAVTVTVIGLVPVTRPLRPEITRDAFASAALATTVTRVVPLARFRLEPSTTAVPLTVKTLNAVLLESASTLTVTE